MRLLILLFACLLCRRGRTRGRVVLDEEDSMDGTEVAESIGPLDTGETLKLLFFSSIMFVLVMLRVTYERNLLIQPQRPEGFFPQ